MKERIDAKHALDNYLYSVRSSMNNKLKGKISEDDKQTLEESVSEG